MSGLWTPGPKAPRRARLHVGDDVVEIETMKPSAPVWMIALDQGGQPTGPALSVDVASITVRHTHRPGEDR